MQMCCIHACMNGWIHAYTLTRTYVHTSAWAWMKLERRRCQRWLLPLGNFTQTLTRSSSWVKGCLSWSPLPHQYPLSEFIGLACRLMVQLRGAAEHVCWKGLPGWWSKIKWHWKNYDNTSRSRREKQFQPLCSCTNIIEQSWWKVHTSVFAPIKNHISNRC